jgi:XapX domain-containing protein
MIKIILGFVLALLTGAGCRWFDIPVPSPPKILGAMLVVAMAVGYTVTDKFIAAKSTARGPATTQHLCGVPTGALPSQSGPKHFAG